MASLWLFSSGDGHYLEVGPLVVDGLPGHSCSVALFRPYASISDSVVVTLENMSPEVVAVPETVFIPAGARFAEIQVEALQSGTANVRASAESFGEVTFTVNVLDPPGQNNAVSPQSIQLKLDKGQAATQKVAALVPADAVPAAVDIAFAVDDRPSFAAAEGLLADAVPTIIDRLKSAFPSVNFAFSVSKFQDYGGHGAVFEQFVPTPLGTELARPFVLLLPTTAADTPENIAAIAAAMKTRLPGQNPTSVFASYTEALQQIAQGTGFDGDANGSRLDSGPAAVPGGGSQPGYLVPGASGDVPPFSSKPASVPSAGSVGGVGFRTGAQKLMLLATNTYPVSPLDSVKPFPAQIVGTNGVALSSAYFQEVLSYPVGTFQNPRFGPVSNSVSRPDPPNAVAPKGAAILSDVFNVLAAQHIQVIGFFQISQSRPEGTLIDPKTVLSAVATLTGAVDATQRPLVFELIGPAAANVADTVLLAVRPPLVAPRQVTLRAVGNDAGYGFSFTPQFVTVAPGGTAEFAVTITGTGAAGSFEIQFVTADGTIIGRIPVTIEGSSPPIITALDPGSGPIGTQVTISGSNLVASGSATTVTFGGLDANVKTAEATRVVAVVPDNSVAGVVPVVVKVGNVSSNSLPFTVLHTITGLTPASGVAGSGFAISGSAFAPSVGGNRVTFGTNPVSITEAANTLVRGTVPNVIGGPYPVSISTNGITTGAGTFVVLPSLTGVAPSSGPGNSGFTLSGIGFSPTAADDLIMFTDAATAAAAPAAVTAAAATSLSGTVPVQLVAGRYGVSTAVRGASSNAVAFTVVPVIAATPAVVTSGSQIRITGTGLSGILAENAVTLNGKPVSLDAGSSQTALLATVPAGTQGTSVAVVVTVRGVASNTVTLSLSQSPVITAVNAIFQTRQTILLTVTGTDPNGDVKSLAVAFKDGEGQDLGTFEAIDVQGQAANQTAFTLMVPFATANHFTAANTVTVQLTDAAGNKSAAATGRVVNPDIRSGAAFPAATARASAAD
jgi:hypothetical protein